MDEERALSQHISDVDLRVIVIVKRPLLALRYTLPDGQTRKTQMNFVPLSGFDVAFENFRAAGLPVRDRDLSLVQGQRPQSSQSQPPSRERPRALNAGQATRPHSSAAFLGSSQRLSQDGTEGRNVGYGSIRVPPSAQPAMFDLRPTSAPGGMNQDEFSRPISASSRSTLDTIGSTTTATTVSAVAQPRIQPRLLPSPVFNGTYEPFGSFHVRPMSALEQVQAQRDYTDTLPLSQMLPPERTLPFPKKIHPFGSEEAASQEEKSQEKSATAKNGAKRKTGARRKTEPKGKAKPRAQSTIPRKSRATVKTATTPSDRLAPGFPSSRSCAEGETLSSSAPPKARATAKAPSPGVSRVPSPEVQAIPPSSEPPAAPSIIARKHSMSDPSVNQPNKRQVQTSIETVTETITEEALTTTVPKQAPQVQPPQATDVLVNIANRDLLDSIDNLVRKYHDLPAPEPPPRSAEEHLAEYAAQSDDDRAKAIDNMICKYINDENFWKLMDDVEGSWKRIGLGF